MKEHKMLRCPGCNSQFKLLMEDGIECLQYMKDLSTKTNHGGLKHAKVKAKIVMVYPAQNSDRCPVCLFKKYVSMLPNSYKYKELYLQSNIKKEDSEDGPVVLTL